MTLKIVSTLILSGHSEECKCEIYQQDTAEGPKFNACLYVRREVLMVLKRVGRDSRQIRQNNLKQLILKINQVKTSSTKALLKHMRILSPPRQPLPFSFRIFLAVARRCCSRTRSWRNCRSNASAGRWRLLRLCLLYTSPSPRDRQKSRMPSSA